MLTRPSQEALKSIDWAALEAVRKRAEDAGATLTKADWQKLFSEALVATGGRRAPALDQLALYGAPDWVPKP
jgi:hypothetical protein